MSLLTNIVNVTWKPQRTRVVNRSPFTGRRQQSTLRFHIWEFLVQYAPTKGNTATAKLAALRALRGGDANFDFRDPSRAATSTAYSGADGAIDVTATGYTMAVKGLTALTAIALAGDFVSAQIDGKWQLFTLAADATTDSGGDVTLSLDNPIRGSGAVDDVVKFQNWLVTVSIEDNEEFSINKNGLLFIPNLRLVEDF